MQSKPDLLSCIHHCTLPAGDTLSAYAEQTRSTQLHACTAPSLSMNTLGTHAERNRSVCYAGDTTVQLLWRIQNGELPVTTDTKQAVVLIGTNDLTAYHQHQVQTLTASKTGGSCSQLLACICLLLNVPSS